MSQETFLLAVKSTIDRVGVDLAAAQASVPAVRFVDLDDATAAEEAMASPDTVFVWEMNTLEETPRDPLYSGTLNFGVRTINDPANYSILRFAGIISKVFHPGARFDVIDQSEAIASASQGSLYIVNTGVNPQAFDRTSGVRMVSIAFRAHRWP